MCAVLHIGFEPTVYQVSEADGQVDVCFQVLPNIMVDITAQATVTLNTISGSATCKLNN